MKIQRAAVIFLFVSLVDCERILVSAPYGSRSHQNSWIALIKALAQRDHHLTVITNYAVKEFKTLPNIQQIELDMKLDTTIFGDAFKKAIYGGGSLSDSFKFFNKLSEIPSKVVNSMYTDERVQELLKSGEFDMVMVSQFFNYVSYPLAWHFNATLTQISPASILGGLTSVLGDSDHPEHLPNLFSEMTDQMNLVQRVVNTVSIEMSMVMFTWHRKSVYSEIKTLLPDCPPLDEIEKETSLVFTNTHPIFHYPRTMTPEMIEIGGIHCKPANPLPPALDEFVGDHEPGFIIFGVGSALNMNDMPEYMVDAFVQVFGQLPQRVIWQWKGEQKTNLPGNIMTVNWLPQQDLLGHKNCRLFLTHGGLNSLMEAVYHGVPVLGLPLSSDQFGNLARVEKAGYGQALQWKDVNKDTLRSTLQELLTNSKYLEKAKSLSELLRDQPQTPLDRAVYWTEFYLRHNGAKHLRLGSRYLSPYQRALVDVYAVITAVILLPIALLVLVVRKCCCSKRTNKTVKAPADQMKKKQ